MRVLPFHPLKRSVCLMGKGVEDRIVKEQLKQQDKEMQEVISASSSEAENDGEKKIDTIVMGRRGMTNMER